MAIRTDLALEKCEMHANEISGVESNEYVEDGIKVTHIKITDEKVAQKLGKPIGSYVTIETDALNYEDDELLEKSAKTVCRELEKLIKNDASAPVLVVGLGNQYITPDSIGPKTVGKLFVTRHLNALDEKFDFRSVSAIAPGVLGLTGIETMEIVEGIAERISPKLIIAVDALASRKIKRLGATVQLSDTGINPGSGVGNNRKELSKKSLGVPVIAIGVPMVVDAATMTEDSIEAVSQYLEKNSKEDVSKMLGIFSEADKSALIKEALNEDNENMIVTPNNVDVISNSASEIIAQAINMALHKEIFE